MPAFADDIARLECPFHDSTPCKHLRQPGRNHGAVYGLARPKSTQGAGRRPAPPERFEVRQTACNRPRAGAEATGSAPRVYKWVIRDHGTVYQTCRWPGIIDPCRPSTCRRKAVAVRCAPSPIRSSTAVKGSVRQDEVYGALPHPERPAAAGGTMAASGPRWAGSVGCGRQRRRGFGRLHDRA